VTVVPPPRTDQCFVDADRDGFGTDEPSDCDRGAWRGGDCDDGDPAAGGAPEERPYNGRNDDCDPSTPDDDVDDDGWRLVDDCDDTDPLAGGGEEVPYNGRDDDCRDDTLDDDLDRDGVEVAADCDDRDASVGAVAVDADCDGLDDAEDCAPDDPSRGAFDPDATLRPLDDADCDGVVETDADLSHRIWEGLAPDQRVGAGVALGDVDDVGGADVAIAEEVDGQVVIHVRASQVVDTPSQIGRLGGSAEARVVASREQLAPRLDLAGDHDGDGRADLLVPYSADPSTGPSGVAVFSGASLAPGVELSLSDAAMTSLPLAEAEPPQVAAWAGDPDGDGLDDWIVAAGKPADGLSLAGHAELMLSIGPSLRLMPPPDTSVVSAAPAGDVDGDGLDDVAVGFDGFGPATPGGVALFGGAEVSADLPLDANDALVIIVGAVGADPETGPPGSVVAGGHDVDGDGLADLLLGSGHVSFGGVQGAGTAGLFTAQQLTARTVAAEDAWASWFGTLEGDGVGEVVASVGDMDGDGLGELAVLRRGTGQLAVVRSSTLAAGATPFDDLSVRIDGGDAEDALLATSGLGAGDLDGDGAVDLLVGDPGWDSPQPTLDVGRAYLVLSPWGTP